MSGAFVPLRTDENFISYLYLFDAQSLGSLLVCVALACFLTVIVQSSSAMLDITITLAAPGVLNFITTVLTVSVTQDQSARGYGMIRMADEIESIADAAEFKALIADSKKIKKLGKDMRERHLDRLRAGECQGRPVATRSCR